MKEVTTIYVDDLERLLNVNAMVERFKDYIKGDQNETTREVCAEMFGFDLLSGEMDESIENQATVDLEQTDFESDKEDSPICECCEEKIKQFRALHILSGKKRIWICDRCIEDMKEVTGW